MLKTLARWLGPKWSRTIETDLAKSYHATFSTPDGQRVLQHLLDNIYFTTYGGVDPNTALVLNARRTVVQEILENIDLGERPHKYVLVEELPNAS